MKVFGVYIFLSNSHCCSYIHDCCVQKNVGCQGTPLRRTAPVSNVVQYYPLTSSKQVRAPGMANNRNR
jgi:hypothetical protein